MIDLHGDPGNPHPRRFAERGTGVDLDGRSGDEPDADALVAPAIHDPNSSQCADPPHRSYGVPDHSLDVTLSTCVSI